MRFFKEVPRVAISKTHQFYYSDPKVPVFSLLSKKILALFSDSMYSSYDEHLET